MNESVSAGITVRVRQALDAAGITPARYAAGLGQPAAYAEAVLSGARPVSSLAVAVAAEMSGEDVDFLISGERSALRIIGPCRMPGEA
jgi:hypothetical protein